MSKCGGCGKFLTGGVTCSKCKATYHRQCVNISTNQAPKQWLCPCCVAIAPRKDNSETPVKEPEKEEVEGSPQALGDLSEQHLVLEELRALRREMTSFRQDFGSFREEVRDELRDLRSMYTSCNDKMEAFSERLESQDARLRELETNYEESKKLVLELAVLKQELKDREQVSLLNDIEINGITEHKGENILHIVLLMMTKIGLKLEEQEIVDVHRVGSLHTGEASGERARPIVMRVARRAVREQILRGARARRSIATGDLGLAGASRPVYINERLTKDNRLLFGRVRALCREHKWRFAWTRDGKVMIREGDGKPAFRIRCEDDVVKILKQSSNSLVLTS